MFEYRKLFVYFSKSLGKSKYVLFISFVSLLRLILFFCLFCLSLMWIISAISLVWKFDSKLSMMTWFQLKVWLYFIIRFETTECCFGSNIILFLCSLNLVPNYLFVCSTYVCGVTIVTLDFVHQIIIFFWWILSL